MNLEKRAQNSTLNTASLSENNNLWRRERKLRKTSWRSKYTLSYGSLTFRGKRSVNVKRQKKRKNWSAIL
jgi:hypothetical protein